MTGTARRSAAVLATLTAALVGAGRGRNDWRYVEYGRRAVMRPPGAGR